MSTFHEILGFDNLDGWRVLWPYRMLEMPTVSTDVPVALYVTRLLPAKVAKRIEVRFVVETRRGTRNIVLGGGLIPKLF